MEAAGIGRYVRVTVSVTVTVAITLTVRVGFSVNDFGVRGSNPIGVGSESRRTGWTHQDEAVMA